MDIIAASDYRFTQSLPTTILVGSGISTWKPSELPSGQQFAGALFGALFWDEPVVPAKQFVEKVPFENAMELCPAQERLEALIRGVYNSYRPNPIHTALARAVADRRVESIVTTNYDCCLDQAFSEQFATPIGSHLGPLARVVEPGDAPTGGHLCCYFKIHGSTDVQTPGTLIFQLRDESALPAWKRRILTALWHGRTLLIIGYSGLDFEISPEIPLIRPADIVWNFYTEAGISPNARRVMDAVPGKVVVGDMKILLGRAFSPVEAERGQCGADLLELFKTTFSETERLLWRSRLLNRMGAAALASTACSRLTRLPVTDASPEFAVLEQQAQAAFHTGRYGLAARTFERAARLAPTHGRRCALVLAACDSWRARGSFWRSWVAWVRAKRIMQRSCLANEQLIGQLELKKVLLFRNIYQIARMLRLERLMSKVLKLTASSIRRGSAASLSSGSWFDFQQFRFWADRLGLPREIARPPGLYEAPPPREGYLHLGYVVAQMMDFRDSLDNSRRPVDDEAARELLRWIEVADQFGCHPEAWKLRDVLLRHFSQPCDATTAQAMAHHFSLCDYALPVKLYQKLRLRR